MPIYFVQKTKRTFLKTSCCRLVYKKEKKNKAFVYKSSTSMTKLCSFCLRQSLPMAKKKKTENTCLWKKKQQFFVLCFQAELFFLSTFQNEESKKQTIEVRTIGQKFLFFLSRQQCCCARQWNIFLFHNCPKPTSLWQLRLVEKKSSSFFLLKKLRSYKKKCNQRFVMKSNGQFHFFVTPTHQVMIVIANFNVFEHPPTQV